MTATIILCVLLALTVAASIRYLVRQRRAGKYSCGGSCDHCHGCAGCGRYHEENDGAAAPRGESMHRDGASDADGQRGGDGV